MRMSHFVRGGVVAGLAMIAGEAVSLAQAVFEPLGSLPSVSPLSRAWGVSADGQIVVGESASPRSGSDVEAFRKEDIGPLVGLGTLDPTYYASVAYAVSGDGAIAVGGSFFDATRVDQAFRWTADGMVGLGGFPPAPTSTQALGANWDGSVVVGVGKSVDPVAGGFRDQAWRWASGNKVLLGFLPVPNPGNDPNVRHRISYAFGVSGDGQRIVGFSASNVDQRAVVWNWPSLTASGLSGDQSLSSVANAISNDGRVIVGNAGPASGGLSAFRWTAEEGLVLLGDLPSVTGAPFSSALAVNAHGTVIVGYADAAANGGSGEAMVWDFAGMRSLREALVNGGATGLTGWELWWATGVSADGQTIVGFGRNPQGRIEGFRAILPRCDIDFDLNGVVNLDDLSTYITEYYTVPAIPGGLQPLAPERPGVFAGSGVPCPAAPDAPAPYAAGAYRAQGYRVGFSVDESNVCPVGAGQSFPNLDNLSDFITAFYGTTCLPR
jgi:uncharacterized membrane protein